MKTLSVVLAVTLQVLFIHPVSADVVTLNFDSDHSITGDVDGSNFTSSDWSFSFSVDDTSPDTDIDSDRGIFDNPVSDAQLRIDSNVYDIPSSNFTTNTQLLLYDFSGSGGNLNSIAIYFDAGGINFSAGNGAAFPGLFADNNDISTASGAISGFNSDANQLTYSGDFSLSNLLANGGESITVDFAELNVGSTTVSTIAIPEPGSVGSLLAATAVALVRRRKTTFR